MRSLIAITAFTVAVATGALAGGNPEEENTGFMTRERIEAPKPVQIPDQFKIQRQIEAEILRGSEGSDTLDNAPTMTATEIADEQDGGFDWADCASFFSWLPVACSSEEFSDHNPSPTGYHTVTAEKEIEVEKTKRVSKKFKSKRSAYRKARKLSKRGWKVKVRRARHGWKVYGKKTVTTIEVVTVTKRVRGDGRPDGGRNTAADSNFSDGGGGSGNRSRDY